MQNLENWLEHEPDYTEAVVGFMLRGDKVLLGLRKKVSDDLGQDNYAGIGGKLESGEDADSCLVREIEEEIGVRVTEYKAAGNVRFINPHNVKWNMRVEIYIVTDWEGEPVETEVIKSVWFSRTDIPYENMFRDNKFWLPKVLEGQSVEGVFLFGEDHGVEEMQVSISD